MQNKILTKPREPHPRKSPLNEIQNTFLIPSVPTNERFEKAGEPGVTKVSAR